MGSDGKMRRGGRTAQRLAAALSLILAVVVLAPGTVSAQNFSFSSVRIEGNQRVSGSTILTYAGIDRGRTLSAAELNDAAQSIRDSGLFESVSLRPRGGTLVIRVEEYPTISRITVEGNRRVDDETLIGLVRSQARRVYSPSRAEADAERIAEAYEQQGRLAASVTPRIIPRSDNRVDLVFEVGEGRPVEIERISFVGNRTYSDRRLRRVLETKQAGLLRRLVRNDTFIADRLQFDRKLLTDFYRSRGFIDFQVLSVASELTRERDAFLITVKLREGQQFSLGDISVTTGLDGVDTGAFEEVVQLRRGQVYSPTRIQDTVARMERLATRKGLDFVRVQPDITRNDRALTLDVDLAIVRGKRVFVQRIDISGNKTTLDRVIRRQFDTVEGDPFNPREIRRAAERIRALDFFETADVNAREGTRPDQVIVDVDVEEKPTGSLSFGASYGVSQGVGLQLAFSERNFLGRGQSLDFRLGTGTDNATSSLSFTEPAFLGRDVSASLDLAYSQTSDQNSADYDTRLVRFSPSLGFPLTERSRLGLRYAIEEKTLDDYTGGSPIIAGEAGQGGLLTSRVGYTYSFDNRRTGLDPTAGVLLRFGQDVAGLGGDTEYLETTALLAARRTVLNEDVTLRAELEGGAIAFRNGESRVTDRYFAAGKIRGFEPDGIGPRDREASSDDALGGNYFAVARFEAEFPVGLPESYGVTGGVFADVGSVWGLDDTQGVAGPTQPGGEVDDDLNLRSSLGVSVFWKTPIGPLRFNFSKALVKEDYDEEQNFDLTISTRF